MSKGIKQPGASRPLTIVALLIIATTLAVTAACGDDSGMITTETGLQIETLREGDGPSPTANDRVRVHYRGMLTDSTQFDSSYDSGQPSEFNVDGVIEGFGEALQLMSVGSHIRVTIPPELGFGEAGAGDVVGPNATLVFEIELLGIVER